MLFFPILVLTMRYCVMTRSFLSFTFAPAIATVFLIVAGATPAMAQPAASRQAQYPEWQEANQLLTGPSHDMRGAIGRWKKPRKNIPNCPRHTC